MLQQVQAQLEEAQITTVCPMNDRDPVVMLGLDTQKYDPDIGQTSSYQQTCHALWVRDMALMQMKAPAFLVREKGLNAKAFAVPIASFFSQLQIGNQENRFFITFSPPGNDQNRAVSA